MFRFISLWNICHYSLQKKHKKKKLPRLSRFQLCRCVCTCWCVCVELSNSEWTQKSTNSVRPETRQHIQGKGSGVNLAYNPPLYPFHYHSIQLCWRIFKQIGRKARKNNHKFRKEVFKQFTIVALSVILLSYITKPNKNKKKEL